ncbi:hypothetical protein TNCV_4374811 [Trichonephila clavipes]|uniref:Uncharacterized protein n=1 Tax=Trichonephila clavipes TaxID=2585209 RepID=A0A8X6W1X0_TRICX|nr:hypothetical protein TNCV_4374811 [Trichonephila clavipes]
MNRKLSQLYYTTICSTWPPPQGRRHSRRVTNPATAECNMSGCMEDTSLRIASFSSGRLDGPDRYTRDFKYPPNQKSSDVKSGEPRRPWVPAAPANDSVFPERLYQECLNGVSSVTGCSILHERDIRNLTSLN